jgi:hypothetical protein
VALPGSGTTASQAAPTKELQPMFHHPFFAREISKEALRRLPPWLSIMPLTLFWAAAPPVLPAAAVLDFSNAIIVAQSTYDDSVSTLVDREEGVAIPGIPDTFEALLEPANVSRFPVSPSSLPVGFM